MNIYKYPIRYKICKWLEVIGRSFTLFGMFILLSCAMAGVENFNNYLFVFLFIIGIGICTGWTSIFLSFFVKCEICGQKVRDRNIVNKKFISFKNEINGILSELIYPIEIRKGQFSCEHCGTNYILKKG